MWTAAQTAHRQPISRSQKIRAQLSEPGTSLFVHSVCVCVGDAVFHPGGYTTALAVHLFLGPFHGRLSFMGVIGSASPIDILPVRTFPMNEIKSWEHAALSRSGSAECIN